MCAGPVVHDAQVSNLWYSTWINVYVHQWIQNFDNGKRRKSFEGFPREISSLAPFKVPPSATTPCCWSCSELYLTVTNFVMFFP